jgi:hypothetical protein
LHHPAKINNRQRKWKRLVAAQGELFDGNTIYGRKANYDVFSRSKFHR